MASLRRGRRRAHAQIHGGDRDAAGNLGRMASRSNDRSRSKQRSLEERVDAWGENQKAARRNLPRKRARIQRAYRRAVAVELANGEEADAGAIRRKPFLKWAGPIRRVHLERQAARRGALQEHPRRTGEARRRRRTK